MKKISLIIIAILMTITLLGCNQGSYKIVQIFSHWWTSSPADLWINYPTINGFTIRDTSELNDVLNIFLEMENNYEQSFFENHGLIVMPFPYNIISDIRLGDLEPQSNGILIVNINGDFTRGSDMDMFKVIVIRVPQNKLAEILTAELSVSGLRE